MEGQSPVDDFSILMFPWLAHGHIFPFLELAKALLARKKDTHIYFCSTAVNFDSIKSFIDKHHLSNSIRLLEIHLQTSELPPHYHTTKNLPPHLNSKLLEAIQTASSSFADIIATFKPDLVIYDVFQPWASKVAAKQGITSVYFSTYGALSLAYRHHQYTHGYDEFPFPAIKLNDFELNDLEVAFEFLYENIYDVDQDFLFGNFKQSCEIVLVKTCKGIEGKYIDYLSDLSHKKIVPVGPLITHDPKNIAAADDDENSDVTIQWLDRQKQNSTVLVSFGSEYFLSEDEIREIAKGLELSESNFIWIVRFPADRKATSLEDALPPRFLDRVKGRGMVVTGWAPQVEILAHPCTGGLVTHCGWSSIMESMFFGLPVIAMPMKLDQPINARMLSEAGSCVEVLRNDGKEAFKAEEIAKAIKKVVAEESGDALRIRARELSETMKMEKEEALDEAAEQIWKLCVKRRKRQENKPL